MLAASTGFYADRGGAASRWYTPYTPLVTADFRANYRAPVAKGLATTVSDLLDVGSSSYAKHLGIALRLSLTMMGIPDVEKAHGQESAGRGYHPVYRWFGRIDPISCRDDGRAETIHLAVKRPTCGTGRPEAVALSGEGARRKRKPGSPQSRACASSAGRSARRTHFNAYRAGGKPFWPVIPRSPPFLLADDGESRSGWAHRWPPVRARFLAELP